MSAPWLYDEWAQVGTDYADKAHVREYDAGMQRLRDIPQEVETVAQALSLSGEAITWEIGTGTGEMSLGLAARCLHVFATDVSIPMLDLAREKAAQRHITNVTFEAGGFLSGFAPPSPVDAVVTQLALHHLPDFWKMAGLRRIAQHMKPGGRLFIRDIVFPANLPDYDSYFSGAVENIRAAAGDALAESTIAHIREEYSTFDWVLEEMLRQTGFRIVSKTTHGLPTVYECILDDTRS
jgi:putative AdoMet-dependent methyltransferase